MNYTEEPGEAAFYGPKLDFLVKDCIGREWQLGTVQVDYNLPERFKPGVHRRGQRRPPAGDDPPRAVRLLERFVGILIEHFAGAFPLWLSPVQVAVLPVSDKFNDTPARCSRRCRQAGLRAELDDAPDKIGAKIRRATLQKVPYMGIVGAKEEADGSVSVRHRTAGDLASVPVEEFVSRLSAERTSRGGQVAFEPKS